MNHLDQVRSVIQQRHYPIWAEEAYAQWLLGEIAVRHDPLDAEQADTHYRQALTQAGPPLISMQASHFTAFLPGRVPLCTGGTGALLFEKRGSDPSQVFANPPDWLAGSLILMAS